MRQTLLRPLLAASKPIPTFRTRPCFAAHAVTPCYPRTLVSAAEMQFGQPLHETHPHLIAAGELTPGISALEYHHRRAALAQKLPRNGVAVLAASELKYRSGAVFYEFHQEPNFYYLTGFNEQEAVAVIEKGDSSVEYAFHLFVRPKVASAEKWDGARSGVQAAQDVFNADEAYDVDRLQAILPDLVSSAREVYTDIGSSARKSPFSRYFAGITARPEGFAKALQGATINPLRAIMNELRLTKSEAELNCMRKAGSISGKVIADCMRRHYDSEKRLWVDLAHGFKIQGLDGEAYIPVVASGTNGLSIHYTANNAQLKDGETVLVDAGGEYGGYITDITRCWPVNRRFSPAQIDLYTMLLEVQQSGVSLCREDADVSLDKLHRFTESQLKNGLKDLGFDVSGDAMDVLFPHHVGHYIGLDVHDAPGYPRTDRLRERQCITIEPGVYVADEERWPAHFRGMALRIEDSVVIGKEKVEVLTGTAVKSVDEIEALRS